MRLFAVCTLKRQKKRAVMKNSFKNILAINASAGSGKTYQLTLRYLSLLFLGAHPSKILAVTFTKKAAKEMRERIAETLIGLESGKIGVGHPLIASIEEVYKGDIRARAKVLLTLYLSSNNKISTIDSFVHQVLRKFCFYASVRHDFELFTLEPSELKSRFLELLEDGQKERLADYLYARGDTIDKLLGLFGALYEEESDLVAIKQKFESYDRRTFFTAKSAFLEEANRFYGFLCAAKPQKFAPKIFTSVKEFLKTNSFEKLIIERDNLLAHRDYKALSNEHSEMLFASLKSALTNYYEASTRDTLSFILHEFDWYKRARESINKEKNALGFDDIAKTVKELLENGKIDSDFLYFRLDGEIDHILIDEFQDTSILQFRIIRPLLDEILSGIGTGEFKSFFLVGDPKQSIYRFRGAAAGMFENATRYIKQKAERRYEEAYLDTNYRSDKAPVACVNELFAPLYKDMFKAQKSASETEGFTETISVDAELLVNTVADKVAEYISLGAREDAITVLCYTNDDIEDVAACLEARGIKTQKESSKALMDDDAVRAVAVFIEYILLRSLGRDTRLVKLNFLSLTKASSDDFDLLAIGLNASTPPAKAIFEIVNFFGLANPNTIKLIELACAFDDMHTLIESNVIANEKKIFVRQDGVSLMTVHKSKGLEFGYCIICDTLKKKDSSRMRPILQVYEDFRLKELVMSGKSLAALLPQTKAAMEEEDRMEERDLQNANYVAMTRAKHGMCIIRKAQGHSKLQFCGNDGISGIKQFYNNKIESTEEKSFYYGVRLDKKLGRQEDIVREDIFKPENYRAIDFGLALHSYFEVSNTLSHASEAAIYLKNKYGLLLGSSLEQVLSLSRSFNISGFEDSKIYKEISICTQDEKNGLKLHRIDLLALSQDKAVIMDFKSSHEVKEIYKKQLSIYKNIVSNILNMPVKTYLALDNGGSLEMVLIEK